MNLIRLFASATLVAGLGSVAIACSSDGESGGSVDSACAEYASAVTAYLTRCAVFGTGVNESRLKVACASGLSLNGTAITPQTLSNCAAAVKGLSCDGAFEDLAACDFPPGKLAAGAGCVAGAQCATEYCKQGDGACGVCAARVAIGGACRTTLECVENARCSSGKCVTDIENPVGASCDSTTGVSCQRGLYCDYATKTCKTFVAEGGSCASAPCKTDLTCDSTSKTCVKPTLAAEGQACSTTVRCQTGLACDPTAAKCAKVTIVAPGGDCGGVLKQCETGSCDQITKKCPTIIADGGACVADDPTKKCELYASCVDGKCVLPAQIVCK